MKSRVGTKQFTQIIEWNPFWTIFSTHIVLFSTTVHIARCENFLFEERYILEKTIGNRVTVTAGERIEILLEAVGTGP